MRGFLFGNPLRAPEVQHLQDSIVKVNNLPMIPYATWTFSHAWQGFPDCPDFQSLRFQSFPAFLPSVCNTFSCAYRPFPCCCKADSLNIECNWGDPSTVRDQSRQYVHPLFESSKIIPSHTHVRESRRYTVYTYRYLACTVLSSRCSFCAASEAHQYRPPSPTSAGGFDFRLRVSA